MDLLYQPIARGVDLGVLASGRVCKEERETTSPGPQSQVWDPSASGQRISPPLGHFTHEQNIALLDGRLYRPRLVRQRGLLPPHDRHHRPLRLRAADVRPRSQVYPSLFELDTLLYGVALPIQKYCPDIGARVFSTWRSRCSVQAARMRLTMSGDEIFETRSPSTCGRQSCKQGRYQSGRCRSPRAAPRYACRQLLDFRHRLHALKHCL